MENYNSFTEIEIKNFTLLLDGIFIVCIAGSLVGLYSLSITRNVTGSPFKDGLLLGFSGTYTLALFVTAYAISRVYP